MDKQGTPKPLMRPAGGLKAPGVGRNMPQNRPMRPLQPVQGNPTVVVTPPTQPVSSTVDVPPLTSLGSYVPDGAAQSAPAPQQPPYGWQPPAYGYPPQGWQPPMQPWQGYQPWGQPYPQWQQPMPQGAAPQGVVPQGMPPMQGVPVPQAAYPTPQNQPMQAAQSVMPQSAAPQGVAPMQGASVPQAAYPTPQNQPIQAAQPAMPQSAAPQGVAPMQGAPVPQAAYPTPQNQPMQAAQPVMPQNAAPQGVSPMQGVPVPQASYPTPQNQTVTEVTVTGTPSGSSVHGTRRRRAAYLDTPPNYADTYRDSAAPSGAGLQGSPAEPPVRDAAAQEDFSFEGFFNDANDLTADVHVEPPVSPDDDSERFEPVSAEPEPVPVPLMMNVPEHKSNRGLVVVLIAALALAATILVLYFTGVLDGILAPRAAQTLPAASLDADVSSSSNAEVPSVFTQPQSVVSDSIAPASQVASVAITEFSAEPAEASAPATLTFRVQTGASATGVRLINANAEAIPATGSCTPSGDGLLWTFTADFATPYEGVIRAFLRDESGTWRATDLSCTIAVK